MSGFKNFLLRGNLIELAVAFIMGAAFQLVVKAFVVVVMDLVGKVGGNASFSTWQPGGVHLGDFITQLIAFIIVAAVVYYGVIMPYTAAKAKFFPDEEVSGEAEEISVLKEIRDSLANR